MTKVTEILGGGRIVIVFVHDFLDFVHEVRHARLEPNMEFRY